MPVIYTYNLALVGESSLLLIFVLWHYRKDPSTLKNMLVWKSDSRFLIRIISTVFSFSMILCVMSYLLSKPVTGLSGLEALSSLDLFFPVFIFFAPFTEELFFRGYFQTSLAQHYGHRRALLLTALVFSVLHINVIEIEALMLGFFGLNGQSFFSMVFTGSSKVLLHMPSSLYFGFLVLRYKNLWPAIIAHSAYNFFVPLLDYDYFTQWYSHLMNAKDTGLLPYILIGLSGFWLYKSMRAESRNLTAR